MSKQLRSIKCRNCGTAIFSGDMRYECPKCGWRYIFDHEGSVIIEPKSQQPKGAPDVEPADAGDWETE